MNERVEAAEHLELIRKMMERGGKFTAISGRGMALSGLAGLLGAVATGILLGSAKVAGPLLGVKEGVLPLLIYKITAIWSSVLVAALAVSFFYIRQKAKRLGYSLSLGIARRLYYATLPALGAGGVFTLYLINSRQLDSIPGAWLLCYGLAVMAGSTVSIAALRLMGGCFLVLGALTLLIAPQWGLVALGLGFGLVHIIFGLAIECKSESGLSRASDTEDSAL